MHIHYGQSTIYRRSYANVIVLTKQLQCWRGIIPTVTRTLGNDHVGMNMTKGNLTRAYVRARRWSEAEVLLTEMLNIMKDDHPDWGETMYGFVHVNIQQGKLEQAQTGFEQMTDILERRKGEMDQAQRNMLERLRGQLEEKRAELASLRDDDGSHKGQDTTDSGGIE